MNYKKRKAKPQREMFYPDAAARPVGPVSPRCHPVGLRVEDPEDPSHPGAAQTALSPLKLSDQVRDSTQDQTFIFNPQRYKYKPGGVFPLSHT